MERGEVFWIEADQYPDERVRCPAGFPFEIKEVLGWYVVGEQLWTRGCILDPANGDEIRDVTIVLPINQPRAVVRSRVSPVSVGGPRCPPVPQRLSYDREQVGPPAGYRRVV